MQTDLQKRAIREAFSDAASRYDSVACLQREIANTLLEKCAATSGIVLDAGSGTGYARGILQKLGSVCVALDLAQTMLLQSSGTRICGDIEALPLSGSSIALYYSSLAWQWTDPAEAIAEAARVIQPGGYLAAATLGPDTLHELRDAFHQADNAEHVRQFAPLESYSPLLAAAGFESIVIERAPFTTHAPDFQSLLHDIKTLGAHVIDRRQRQGLFGVQGFRRAEAHYERLRQDAGLPLTYDAVFISARRSIDKS